MSHAKQSNPAEPVVRPENAMDKKAANSIGRAMLAIGSGFQHATQSSGKPASSPSIVRVVPSLQPGHAIGSNDVDVIRGVRPSKYAGLDRATRVSFRASAKAAGLSVEEWMAQTGNDNAARGAQPVLESAIQARALGYRRCDVGHDVLGNTINTGMMFAGVYGAAIRAAVGGLSGMATNIGLAIERR